jgi:hypothetical protein
MLLRAYFSTVSVFQYSTSLLNVIVNETLVSYLIPHFLIQRSLTTGHQSGQIIPTPSSGVTYFRKWTLAVPYRTTWNPLTLVYSVTPTFRLLIHLTALARSFQRTSTSHGPHRRKIPRSLPPYCRARTRSAPRPTPKGRTSPTSRCTGITRFSRRRSMPCMGQICRG